jgi:MHS family shikimate/dehydroshikimate transporter-like MFS transporter
MVGAIADWYDYFLYGTAAALVLGPLYFPGSNATAGTLAAFATFAVGFFFRPVGSIFFGHFGDRIGRKRMLVLTMVLMGGSSTLIGVLPTYGQIGVAAPVLLVVLRAIQGFAVGGEWGGATLMAVESAPAHRKAFFGSVVQIGAYVGLLVATGAFYLFSSVLSDSAFMSWGWRIPFLVSAVILVIGFWVRRGAADTPEFRSVRQEGRVRKIPLLSALRENPKSFLIIVGMRLGENVANYMVLTFAIDYATAQAGVDKNVLLIALIVTSAASLFTVPLIARYADRYGYYRVYVFGAAAGICLAFPFFWSLDTGNTLVIILATFVTLTAAEIAMAAVQQPIFTELFDTEFRYSGAGFAYQFTAAVGGGLTPLIAAWLVDTDGGSGDLAAGYTAVVCAIALATTVAVRQRIRAVHKPKDSEARCPARVSA